MPKVSIIIPVYNVGGYLRGCLDSALDQTLGDIEVICVDDCSTDTSPEVLREYAEKDSRLRVITQPENMSVSQARKEGVRAARGEYIMFLDADDAIAPHACERVYALMREHGADILHFGTAVSDHAGRTPEEMKAVERFLTPHDGTLTGSGVFTGCFQDGKYNFTLWNKAFKSGLCKRGFERVRDGRFPMGEDKYAFFILGFFARSYVGVPGETLHEYHLGRGITGGKRVSLERFEAYCSMARVADAIGEFLEEEGVFERYERIYQASRNQLLSDCVGNWVRHVRPRDKARGFDLMLASWDSAEVIAKIAEMGWHDQGHIAKALKASCALVPSSGSVRTIGTYYHRYGNGGAERVLSKLIELWRSMGYEVVLFTDLPASDDDYPLPEGVERVVLPSYFTMNRTGYGERARELERAITERGIDVMVYHAWVCPILIWDLLVCKAAGAAFAVHCHNVFSHLARAGQPYFEDMTSIYALCDAVVALSDVDAAYWSAFNPNVVTVANPLTFDLDRARRAPLTGKNVLWLARMSEEKRPHDALRIFKKVLVQEPDAKLFMVGKSDGDEYMAGVEELVRDLGIRDSVVMCGYHKDVSPFYDMASVFLLTSEYEGFSLTLAESQSFGVPCVMYELPHLTLTRADKGFISVELSDTEAAAEAVTALLRDEARRAEMGQAARENIEELAAFDHEGAWRALFDTVFDPRERPVLDDSTAIMWTTLLKDYRAGAARRNAEIAELRRRLAAQERALSKRAKKADRQLEKLRTSRSYTLGRALTFVPRRIKRALRAVREAIAARRRLRRQQRETRASIRGAVGKAQVWRSFRDRV